ncbi:MAG: pantetheine-phosphate adenylyltransferase [Nanoarchaeota archaeon]
MTKAIYAFSGDPITYGHIDIVERAARAFEQVIVGIGVNPEKEKKNMYDFSLDERTEMATRSLRRLPNVRVTSFEGMLVDYAYEQGVDVVVKGVRNAADGNYEQLLHQVGESQKLGIDTHILFARPHLGHIASSVVKAVVKEQGRVDEYVPLYIKQCLEAKMLGQYVVGLTGEIGSGKSYVTSRFVERGRQRGIEVHDIDLDGIAHRIIGDQPEPRYVAVRRSIADAFGAQALLPSGAVDRPWLGEKVFGDAEAMHRLNEIMYTPLMVRMRREMKGRKGLLLLDAALIAESDLGYVCNNNAVVVTVGKDEQMRRIRTRGLANTCILDDAQISRRLASQYTAAGKIARLEESIVEKDNGRVWTLDNSQEGSDERIASVFDDVVRELVR